MGAWEHQSRTTGGYETEGDNHEAPVRSARRRLQTCSPRRQKTEQHRQDARWTCCGTKKAPCLDGTWHSDHRRQAVSTPVIAGRLLCCMPVVNLHCSRLFATTVSSLHTGTRDKFEPGWENIGVERKLSGASESTIGTGLGAHELGNHKSVAPTKGGAKYPKSRSWKEDLLMMDMPLLPAGVCNATPGSL